MTNLVLSLLVSTNVLLHWEPSPDTSVVAYHVYAARVSRFTNQQVPVMLTLPDIPGVGPVPANVVAFTSVRVGTNADWIASEAVHWRIGNVTNWTVPSPWDNTHSYWAVSASDASEAESDLSNEVMLTPRWLWVSFAIEGSKDLTNWAVIGGTNLWRVWRPEDAAFFRARMMTK